ncbi:ATP-binding cassette subfamily C protein [Williamsia muralis]|uniref:ATP-binding cassette subfamily C protein n=1 Tax=Williamsia marianensis TaxID=85044 RepID=A0A495JWQ5_WILMA|nr:ABC transporter ATP-binding protein [Williamsia muralis]RKR93456.1 ATP-binding cassette subfamily C protein [Williamsia muralis]
MSPELHEDTRVLPVASGRQTRSWLAAALAHHRAAVARVIAVSALAAIASVTPALALGVLVDRVVAGAGTSVLLSIAAVAAAAALVGGVAAGLSVYSVASLGAGLLADLRESVIRRALRMPTRVLEDTGRGDLLSRVTNDVAAVSKAVITVLPTMVIATILTAVSIATMVGLDWRLGLAGAAALPLYGLALHWYLPRSSPRYAAERRAVGERSQAMVESFTGLRTVHAYGLEASQASIVETKSAAARDISIAAFTVFTRMVGRVNRAEFVGLAAVLVVGFMLVEDGAVSVGATTAAALLFHRLFNPIGMILYSFADLQLAAAGLSRLIGVAISTDVDSDAPADAQIDNTLIGGAPTRGGAVELRAVHFGYDARRPVLRGIDLRIEAGTRVALIGASGAGKSTLAAMVAGNLTPTSGSVMIGGIPLDTLPTDIVRQHVATVSQEVHVFAGPLIDDLRLARPSANTDEVCAALDTIGALEWVRELPAGLDTVVGEGGHQLTDAQAQQIALARLVLVDPPIAVLDEATAEAGSLGARDLERSAAAATAGRTTLVVAHRLSQAMQCDEVVVLDRGTVIERGTPAQLLASEGLFARMWAAWTIQGHGRGAEQ